MPKRKHIETEMKSTPPYKKRKPTAYSRRKVYGPKTPNIVRSRGPVASRTVVRLKYNESVQSDGTIIDYRFNLNSLFDPNRTGTGHQPYGFDTYAALYNRYRVYKVEAIVKALVAGGVYKITLLPNNTSTAETTATLAAEKPEAITAAVEVSNGVELRRWYYLPALNGVTRTQYMSDDRFQALCSASPTEIQVLHLVHSSMADATPGAGVIAYNVTLIYHCEFFDPLELGQS